ncbi:MULTISPECIES: pyridoxamine 5'-phosphate oxidase family protein [Sporosarcina]|uniref:General stress protein 26 n=2 Tax=Sporosarcina newyorkensis TaxID=759851 RepID=A0A1T4XHM9_9BACL|nr:MULTISPECIES: pyridoxamine 5'-phosphate oxidase family protein [Sporosarcina]EGQ27856.1 general stress protein 26 [Sporosarcina newyorkensis 2681]MBY0220829.1 pyridoxamine 5'-phosphate oxidase family protein [Sporosarcina aquimarina]SKA89026.1 General stress protein 26 [Sporosarcina newyorkensis]
MNAMDTVKKILDESFIGTMATVDNNKPYSRYMTFVNDGLSLYTPTSNQTDKVEDLEDNPYTHILIGYEGEGFGDAYVEYAGRVSISSDEQIKKKIWNNQMKKWFDGPEDPKLVILKIEPEAIRLMNKSGEPPQDISL